MQLESIVALGGLLLGLAGFYFPYRASVRKDKDARLQKAEEARLKAIDSAVEPVRTQLEKMEEERDYWRDIVLQHRYEIPRRPSPGPQGGM